MEAFEAVPEVIDLNSFLTEYRNIATKHKKRFLRKPNLEEVSDEYYSLGDRMERLQYYQYAAMCYVAAAKCEATRGTGVPEAQAYAEAARLFFSAETETTGRHQHDTPDADTGSDDADADDSTGDADHQQHPALLSPAFDENILDAVSCYKKAIQVYDVLASTILGMQQFAATLCMEIGDKLCNLKRHPEAIDFFRQATVLEKGSALTHVITLERLGKCEYEACQYSESLQTFTSLHQRCITYGKQHGGHPKGAFATSARNAEICRVLLLMILQPPKKRMAPEHSTLLERYADDNEEELPPPPYMNLELYIQLQFIVSAFEHKEYARIPMLQKSVESFLLPLHRDMLETAIKFWCEGQQQPAKDSAQLDVVTPDTPATTPTVDTPSSSSSG